MRVERARLKGARSRNVAALACASRLHFMLYHLAGSSSEAQWQFGYLYHLGHHARRLHCYA
jgi:hypothetical protein